jgi:hypothetical protein
LDILRKLIDSSFDDGDFNKVEMKLRREDNPKLSIKKNKD